MSDTSDHNGLPHLPEDEFVAAEYALGVLSGAERAEAEQRVARDATFARMVAAWEETLTPWAAEIEEAAPPPHVWEAIAAALPAPSQTAGLWQNLAFWRAFGSGERARGCLPRRRHLISAPPIAAKRWSLKSTAAGITISSPPWMRDAAPCPSCRRHLPVTSMAGCRNYG